MSTDKFAPVKLSDFLAEGPAPIEKATTLDKFLKANDAYYRMGTLRSRVVWIDENDILCIRVFDHDSGYWIEKGRRGTAEEMWEWTQHLHGKTWMTPEIMYDFVFLCGRPG